MTPDNHLCRGSDNGESDAGNRVADAMEAARDKAERLLMGVDEGRPLYCDVEPHEDDGQFGAVVTVTVDSDCECTPEEAVFGAALRLVQAARRLYEGTNT